MLRIIGTVTDSGSELVGQINYEAYQYATQAAGSAASAASAATAAKDSAAAAKESEQAAAKSKSDAEAIVTAGDIGLSVVDGAINITYEEQE